MMNLATLAAPDSLELQAMFGHLYGSDDPAISHAWENDVDEDALAATCAPQENEK